MKKTIYTFGTVKRFHLFLQAFEASARNTSGTDQVLLFTENNIDPVFFNENSTIFCQPRGFGYWLWKSYFINKLLETATDEDVFFYADASNEVAKDLTPLYDICARDQKGIVLFDNRDGEGTGGVWKNNLWTKSDCFNLMGMHEDKYVYGNQVNASYILFRKTDFSIEFFKSYMGYCKNPNILTDLPNVTENFNRDFKDHRHDQSILSLMSIQKNLTILRDPSQWGGPNPFFMHNRGKYYIP